MSLLGLVTLPAMEEHCSQCQVRFGGLSQETHGKFAIPGASKGTEQEFRSSKVRNCLHLLRALAHRWRGVLSLGTPGGSDRKRSRRSLRFIERTKRKGLARASGWVQRDPSQGRSHRCSQFDTLETQSSRMWGSGPFRAALFPVYIRFRSLCDGEGLDGLATDGTAEQISKLAFGETKLAYRVVSAGQAPVQSWPVHAEEAVPGGFPRCMLQGVKA